MTELIVAGEAFNVLVEGEEGAPVLMLSNSLGTNLHMWDKQMPAFLEHFRVVRYDTRGHGGSRVTEGPYSIAQLGRDAVSIMDALRLEKVHWLGLSMGGMIGQWLLTHMPDRIDRAVLANTSAQIGTPDLWNERIRIALENGMPALAPSVVERWFTKSFRESHPDDVATILEVLEATAPEGYAACCGAIRDMDQLEAIRAVAKPVLVIAGRHDPATPPEMSALIVSAIAGAKVVTLDAAHISNIEDPETFNRTVLDFLTAQEAVEETSEITDEEPVEEPIQETTEATNGDASPGGDGSQADEPAPETPKKSPRKRAARKAPVPETAQEPEVPTETSLAVVAEIETLPEAATEEPAPPEPAPAKKPAARRRPTKKTPAKRSPARKPARGVTKKATAKKAPAKKSAAKKAAVKKTSARRLAAKKTAARPAPRKAATKKVATRKAATKKVATRKAVTRKLTAKKSAVRKAVTKKTVAKRAPAKKLAVKKRGAKKIVKKTAVKKTAVKKTTAKKPLRRNVPRRAPGRKTVARRGPGRKR